MLSALSKRSLLFRLSPTSYIISKQHQPQTRQLHTFNHLREHSLPRLHRTHNKESKFDSFTKSSINTMTTAPSTIDLQALGNNFVKKVPSMEQVKLETLWKDSTTVVIFLRRFGCIFCRQSAMEISKIIPLLKEKNVQLCAVGLEDFGLDEFVEGNYFKGDLYVDIDEASYKQIGYKKYGTIGVLMSLLHKTARDAIAKSKSDGIPGNLRGNGLQTGGTLIVGEGGTKILMDYRQTNPADHVANSEILKALGISEAQESNTASNAE